jgi:hypothetical protein
MRAQILVESAAPVRKLFRRSPAEIFRYRMRRLHILPVVQSAFERLRLTNCELLAVDEKLCWHTLL